MAELTKLHGERAARFQRLRQMLAKDLGYEPSNAEAMGLIMAEFPDGRYPPPEH